MTLYGYDAIYGVGGPRPARSADAEDRRSARSRLRQKKKKKAVGPALRTFSTSRRPGAPVNESGRCSDGRPPPHFKSTGKALRALSFDTLTRLSLVIGLYKNCRSLSGAGVRRSWGACEQTRVVSGVLRVDDTDGARGRNGPRPSTVVGAGGPEPDALVPGRPPRLIPTVSGCRLARPRGITCRSRRALRARRLDERSDQRRARTSAHDPARRMGDGTAHGDRRHGRVLPSSPRRRTLLLRRPRRVVRRQGY